MQEEEIRQHLDVIITETTQEQRERWFALRPLGAAIVPYLLEYYKLASMWQSRLFMVSHALKFARTNEDSFQLGLRALSDQSTVVRYEACCLLAYALRADAIPNLQALLTHKDARTVADAKAAIEAIEHQNHSYFMDREHSGRFFWTVFDMDTDDMSAPAQSLIDAAITSEIERARAKATAKSNPLRRLLGGDPKR